jgi:hypothetical protein
MYKRMLITKISYGNGAFREYFAKINTIMHHLLHVLLNLEP